MRYIILTLVFLLILIPDANAYKRYGLIGRRTTSEGSIFLSSGPNYCFGETYGSPTKRSIIDRTNFETALGFKQYFQGNFGYRAEFFYGNYTSHDDIGNRDFGSISNTIGLSARAEYSYYFGGSNRYRTPNHHSVYGFLGLGVVNCNVSPYSNPNKNPKPHSIEPLLPFGFGYSYAFNDDVSLGVEAIWKYSFSDYIDGYHSPEFSRYNDVLGGISVTVSYRIFGRKGYLGH